MDLQRQVIAFVEREALVAPGDTVVAGVSGGPDSLCMLHILWRSRDVLGIRLHVAHLNHQIRGAEADADARAVADLSHRWQLPCTVEARDVRAAARAQGLAIEEAARRERYAFLAEVARACGASRIAVAHNADDQSETVLMHWLRGAALAGLRGMLPATAMADLRLIAPPVGDGDLWLVRPLLETPRAAIEGYCVAQELSPRFDRSNLDTTFYRNKLRHELLPYLERAYKPGFRRILRRSASVIRDDYDLLCTLRDRAWAQVVRSASHEAVLLDRDAWRALHASLQRAVLRHAVQHLRWDLRDVSYRHVENALRVACLHDAGAQATLPRGLMLTVGYRTIQIADRGYHPAPDFPALSAPRVALAVPGVTRLSDGLEIEVEIGSVADLPVGWERNQDPWRATLDADVLGADLALRRRQAGDCFCPLGMGGRSKLVSELLINERVPAYWRDDVPLLVREDGEIMWVCGWRIDERARITERTARVATIALRDSSMHAAPPGHATDVPAV